jgi:hypothetical protein
MEQVYSLYTLDPVVKSVRNTIVNTLFSAGITMKKNDKDAAPEFQKLIDEHWIPFSEECLDHIFMFGFCPVIIVKQKLEPTKKGVKNNGTAEIPYIPPFGTYKIECRVDKDYRQSYHFFPVREYPATKQDEEKRVFLLMSPRYRPTSSGTLRSPCSCLLQGYLFSREMFEHASKVEYLRANPPLITQTRPEKNNSDAVAMEMFADGDAFMSKADSSYRKNKNNLNAFQKQKNLAAMLNGKSTKDKSVRIDPLTGKAVSVYHKQSWEENMFVLPDGQTMAPRFNYQCRTDLMEIERARQSVVCSVFGVPMSLIINSSGSQQSSGLANDITYKMFVRNMEGTKQMMISFLKTVFKKIYKEDTDDTLINLPFQPLTTMDDIIRLGEQGVVSRKTSALYLLRSLFIPEEEMSLQPLPEADVNVKAAPKAESKNNEDKGGKGDDEGASKKRKLAT